MLTQGRWLEPYIQLNNIHRKLATNEFQNIFFKLMYKAVYGKTMENVQKRRSIRLVTEYNSKQNSHAVRQLVAMNNFHSMNLFENKVAALEHTTSLNYCDKAIYI